MFTVQRLQFKDAHNFQVITSIRLIQRKPEEKMRMRTKQVNKVGDASLTPIHCDCLLMDRSPNDAGRRIDTAGGSRRRRAHASGAQLVPDWITAAYTYLRRRAARATICRLQLVLCGRR